MDQHILLITAFTLRNPLIQPRMDRGPSLRWLGIVTPAQLQNCFTVCGAWGTQK